MRRALVVMALCGCGAPPIIAGQVIAHRLVETRALDTAPKEPVRLVPPEALLRSYVRLFGAQNPLEAANIARGSDGRKVFDNWGDYLSALGLPDYKNDLPRAQETNALMLATFERLAEALCDRAIERDLRGKVPVAARTIYAFDLPAQPLDRSGFASRFDVLHRTFLGYPAALAPAGRADDFYALYQKVVARRSEPRAPRTRLSPAEAGVAAVCVALARHPELHLY